MLGCRNAGWYCWWFRGSGSSGYTKSHWVIEDNDGVVRKLCDRHKLTTEQLLRLRADSPKGICSKCNRVLYAKRYAAGKYGVK